MFFFFFISKRKYLCIQDPLFRFHSPSLVFFFFSCLEAYSCNHVSAHALYRPEINFITVIVHATTHTLYIYIYTSETQIPSRFLFYFLVIYSSFSSRLLQVFLTEPCGVVTVAFPPPSVPLFRFQKFSFYGL